jgi:hypothetical protein
MDIRACVKVSVGLEHPANHPGSSPERGEHIFDLGEILVFFAQLCMQGGDSRSTRFVFAETHKGWPVLELRADRLIVPLPDSMLPEGVGPHESVGYTFRFEPNAAAGVAGWGIFMQMAYPFIVFHPEMCSEAVLELVRAHEALLRS